MQFCRTDIKEWLKMGEFSFIPKKKICPIEAVKILKHTEVFQYQSLVSVHLRTCTHVGGLSQHGDGLTGLPGSSGSRASTSTGGGWWVLIKGPPFDSEPWDVSAGEPFQNPWLSVSPASFFGRPLHFGKARTANPLRLDSPVHCDRRASRAGSESPSWPFRLNASRPRSRPCLRDTSRAFNKPPRKQAEGPDDSARGGSRNPSRAQQVLLCSPGGRTEARAPVSLRAHGDASRPWTRGPSGQVARPPRASGRAV